jgi:integrase/recombinase XerD
VVLADVGAAAAGYLRAVGLVPPVAAAVVSDPVERLVARFVEYLLRERGLVAGSSTVYEYQRTARLFLVGRVDSDVGVQRVTAGQVTGFVLAECRRRSVRMSRSLTVSLRGLLRFLFLEGLTSSDVSAAVPSVAGWRGGSLPKAVPAEHVRRLLASCDRTTAVGRRDFAILTLLSRLGARPKRLGSNAVAQSMRTDGRQPCPPTRGADEHPDRAVAARA